MKNNLRPIAVYLPQFYPFAENDEWWGKGFTEWTNVTKAKPLFKGHYQPHLPADLGFYDLRIPQVMEQQAKMASKHGIYGFCYYHYWFNGKRLLQNPIDAVLANGKPDFPFCLCWANENWTRAWDGGSKEILINQDYNFDDDRNHINFLFNIFNDSRYIRIDNKPLFIVYKPELFPDIKKTIAIWRQEAIKANFNGLYICYFENGIQNVNPHLLGFDASIEFQPRWKILPKSIKGSLLQQLLHKLRIKKNVFYSNKVIEYSSVVETMTTTNSTYDYKRFPCITPMWDNTARRNDGATIFRGSTPEIYGNWLQYIIQNFKPYSINENFIFINAWNEWAEGNHLEPCQKWGTKYLEITKKVLDSK